MSKIKEGVNETKNNFKMSWYFIKKQKKIIIPMLILSIILSLIGVLTPILSAKLLLNLSNKALDKLLNIVDSKYKLVHVASIRSKQMLENNHYQMKENEYRNKKSLGRALEEVEAGLIKIIEEPQK